MHKLNSTANSSSIPTILETHNLSAHMRILLDELKKLVEREYDGFIKRLERGKAGKIVDRIYEQGKHDKLSNEAIRACIYFAVGRGMSDRNLRRLLPEELKHLQMVRDNNNGNKESEFADNGRNSHSDVDQLWELDRKDFADLDQQSLLQVSYYYYDRYNELLHSLSESRRKELAEFMKIVE